MFLFTWPLPPLIEIAAAVLLSLSFCANLRVFAMLLRPYFRLRSLVPAVSLWRYLAYCCVPTLRRDLILCMRGLDLDVTMDPRGFCLCIRLNSGEAMESVGAILLADAFCRQRPKEAHAERGAEGLEVYYEGLEGHSLFRRTDDYLRKVMGTRVRRLGDDVKRAKYVTMLSNDTLLDPLSRLT